MKQNKKWHEGYKVLANRCSVSAYAKTVKYTNGEWVARPTGCGPLTVFTSEAAAVNFVGCLYYGHGCKVVPCIYEPSNDNHVWTDNHPISGNKAKMPLRGLPGGTDLADRVKCLE